MSASTKLIHVVAAALMDEADRVLIAQRPAGSHMAGGWEFPGGKLERGELPLQGLARELREELGIEMGAGPHRPLVRVKHDYGEREVSIRLWLVRDYAGVPSGLDEQALRWCRLSELDSAGMLPADKPMIRVLRLPDRLSNAAKSPQSDKFEVQGLRGLLCASPDTARVAAAEGFEFAVCASRFDDASMAALCSELAIPVFASGVSLESAYLLGATGVYQP